MTSLPLDSPSKQSPKANVKVVIRIRPLISAELSNKYEKVTEAISDHMLVFDPKVQQIEGFLHTQRRSITGRRFKDLKYAFDHVLRSSAKNRDVFEKSTQSIVKTVLNGYNCSVFAYGATGSGKTHTMLGNENEPGVIYHTMLDLYKQIDELKDEKIFNVAVSYLEIYNETVRDLLNPKKNLPIREDKMAGVMIAGLSLHKPDCAEDLLHMLHHGNKNRSQHPTDANAESSRSHAVFQVFVKQRSRTSSSNSQVQMAKMCLVDLAGSERAIHTRNVGARFREGANINRSLLALGNVINALAAKSKGHIPYRDSKLTRLLKDSLGGNCQTVMIATISPSSRSYEDTYNTLRYADRAKHIKADLTRNVVNVDQHIVNYKIYVADLERENRDLREKTRLLKESNALCLPPSLSNFTVIKQVQDRMLDLFKARKEIMKTQITSEVVKRELKWKLSRKERSITRVEKLTGLKDVINKHRRMVERMHCRYLKEEVNLQKSTQQLKQHDQSIYNLNTELANMANTDKGFRELLAMSMRFYVTDSYLCDLDMHLCFVKKMARAQERQSMVNERIILNLIQLVQKQQETLKNHNVINPEVEKMYNDCCYLVEERGVAWVQQRSNKSKSDNAASTTDNENGLSNLKDDEDMEDLRISDIIDIQLPKIALNSLRIGNFGCPPQHANQQSSALNPLKTESQDQDLTLNLGLDNFDAKQKLGATAICQQENEPQQHLSSQNIGELETLQVSTPSVSLSQQPATSSQEAQRTFKVEGNETTNILQNDKDKDSINYPINGNLTTRADLKIAAQGIRTQQTPQRILSPNTSLTNTAAVIAAPTNETIMSSKNEESKMVEVCSSLNKTSTLPAATSSVNNRPNQNCKTQVAGNVKKMVEKYSNKESGGGPNGVCGGAGGLNVSNARSSAFKRNSGGNNICTYKRSLFSNNNSQHPQYTFNAATNAPVMAINTTGAQKQTKQIANAVVVTESTNCSTPVSCTLKKQLSSSDPDNKEDNENDNTPTSDKLNQTFEIEKPAIPNTPCIDSPVPKQRRMMTTHLTGNNKRQTFSPVHTPNSCYNNHSNSSYQQKFLSRQLSLTSSSSTPANVEKPFNRRLSFTPSTNAKAGAVNDRTIKLCNELSNNATKTHSPFVSISENNKYVVGSEMRDSSMKLNPNNLPISAKSNSPKDLDRLQKLPKLRAISSLSQILSSQSSSSSSPSSTSDAGVKSSPCLSKWELMRERGFTRGSKIWQSLSAQQLGVSNNNNCAIDDAQNCDEDKVSPNKGTNQVIEFSDQEIKTSTPKMEVEVCISPTLPSQTSRSNKDGGSFGHYFDEGPNQIEATKTPELEVNPYMQTVIRSLKKHGIPSLTERLSLLPGATLQAPTKDAPAPPIFRERSPLRLLDANSSKYQTKRFPNDVDYKPLTTMQEKQTQKVEPVKVVLPLSVNDESATTTTRMKYRLNRVKERRHQRDLSAKPYSRETILANRGQRQPAALRKNSNMKEIRNIVNTNNQDELNNAEPSNINSTVKPSYMLSTFAASQRATGPPHKDKGNNNNNNKLSSWSIFSQQIPASQQPPQRRVLNSQRNKSYLPWLQS